MCSRSNNKLFTVLPHPHVELALLVFTHRARSVLVFTHRSSCFVAAGIAAFLLVVACGSLVLMSAVLVFFFRKRNTFEIRAR